METTGLNDCFTQLNKARNEVLDLKRKYANQQLLISHLEEEVRLLTQDTQVEDGANAVSHSIDPELHDEMQRLLVKNTDLSAEKESLARQTDQLEAQIKLQQLELEQLRAEGDRVTAEAIDYRRSMESKIKASRQLAKDNERLKAQLKDLEGSADEEDPVILRQKLNSLEDEHRALNARYKGTSSAFSQVRSQQANTIQVQKQFIAQLELEFEAITQLHTKERDSITVSADAELAAVRNEYSAFRRMQHDDKRRMLREHQQTLSSIQAQFDEYRSTAEFLFTTEAAKFEDKLNSQMLKFDLELRFVIRAKDRLFDDMVAAKDAKIMSLIDGSDFQAMLIKHELDLDQLRRSHEKELEKIKQLHRSERERAIASLRKELSAQRSVEERVRAQCRSLEGQAKELGHQLAAKEEAWLDREKHYDVLEAEWQERANQLNNDIKALVTDRAALRHKLVRLKFTANPSVKPTVDAILRGLRAELDDLSTKYGTLNGLHTATVGELGSARAQVRSLQRNKAALQLDVNRLVNDYTKLTDAFEAVVSGRTRSVGGATPAPQGQNESRAMDIDRGVAYLKQFKAASARQAREMIARAAKEDQPVDEEPTQEEDAGTSSPPTGQDTGPTVGAVLDETEETAARNKLRVFEPAKKARRGAPRPLRTMSPGLGDVLMVGVKPRAPQG